MSRFLSLLLFLLASIPLRSAAQNVVWEDLNGDTTLNTILYTTPFADGSMLGSSMKGLHRSTNNGRDWELISPVVNGLLDLRASGDAIISTNGLEIISSFDTGKKWGYYYTKDTALYYSCVFINKGVLFAGTDGSTFLRSSDKGKTWTRHVTGSEQDHINGFGLSPNGALLLGANSGIYRSTDNGLTWSEASIESAGVFFTDSTGRFLSIGQKLLRSTDDGASWTALNWINTWDMARSVAVMGKSRIAFNGDNSLWTTSDYGETWTQERTGSFTSLYQAPDRLFSFGWDPTKISYDFGNRWHDVTLHWSCVASVLRTQAGTLLVGDRQMNFFRSTDQGKHWDPINDLVSPQSNVLTIAQDNDGRIFAADSNAIWSSTTDGLTWDFELAASGKSPFIQFAFRDNYVFAIGPGVYVKRPGAGATWENIYSTSGIVNGIALHPDSTGVDGIAITFFDQGNVYYRGDGSTSQWPDLAFNERFSEARRPMFHDGYLYVATASTASQSEAVVRTNDDFVHTESIYSGVLYDEYLFDREGTFYGIGMSMKDLSYKALMIKPNSTAIDLTATLPATLNPPTPFFTTGFTLDSAGYLYLGTDCNGLYRAKLGSDGQGAVRPKSSGASLTRYDRHSQCIDLGEEMITLVEIYDALGRKVLSASNVKGKLDVSELGPGAYFIIDGDERLKFVK
jgi:photosystem II stability/assembly factor-like uncharacterized protein